MPPQQGGLTDEQKAKIRARLLAGGTAPKPGGKAAPAASAEPDLLSRIAEYSGQDVAVPLGMATLLKAIPHPLARIAGTGAQLAFSGTQLAGAADEFRKGNYGSAAGQAGFAALPIIFNRAGRAKTGTNPINTTPTPTSVPPPPANATQARQQALQIITRLATQSQAAGAAGAAPRATSASQGAARATAAIRAAKTPAEVEVQTQKALNYAAREARLLMRARTRAGLDVSPELAQLADDAAKARTAWVLSKAGAPPAQAQMAVAKSIARARAKGAAPAAPAPVADTVKKILLQRQATSVTRPPITGPVTTSAPAAAATSPTLRALELKAVQLIDAIEKAPAATQASLKAQLDEVVGQINAQRAAAGLRGLDPKAAAPASPAAPSNAPVKLDDLLAARRAQAATPGTAPTAPAVPVPTSGPRLIQAAMVRQQGATGVPPPAPPPVVAAPAVPAAPPVTPPVIPAAPVGKQSALIPKVIEAPAAPPVVPRPTPPPPPAPPAVVSGNTDRLAALRDGIAKAEKKLAGLSPATAEHGRITKRVADLKAQLAVMEAKGVPAVTPAAAPPAVDPVVTSLRQVLKKEIAANTGKAVAAGPEAHATANGLRLTAERVKQAHPEHAKTIDALLTKLDASLKKPLPPLQKKAAKDAGFMVTQLMGHLAGAVTGGSAGAYAGGEMRPADAERSKGEYQAAGAAAGALLGLLGANVAMTPARLNAINAKNYGFFSLLSSPGSIARANMGAASSVIIGALEKAGQGNYVAMRAGLKQLFDDVGSNVWFKAAMSPNPAAFLPPQATRTFQRVARMQHTNGLLGAPAKLIAAGDVMSTRALMKMGYSIDDVSRMNLSGDPQSATGRWLLSKVLGEETVKKVLTKTGAIKDVKEKVPEILRGPWAQLLLRWFVPFARVTTALPERMAAYSPIAMTGLGRRVFSDVPGQLVPEALARTRAMIGLGAGAAGYHVAGQTSPELDPLMVAMGGPTAGLVALGQQLRRSRDRDQSFYAALFQQLQTLPLVGEQLRNPLERAVPAGVQKIAEAMDPAYAREKGPEAVASARVRRGDAGAPGAMESLKEFLTTSGSGIINRLPVLRESLPETYRPVDFKGAPLYPERPNWLPDITLRGFDAAPEIVAPRWAASKPVTNAPIFPIDDPLAQRLRVLQRQAGGPEIINPPNPPLENADLTRIAELTDQPIPRMHRDVRLDTQRAQGAAAEQPLDALVNSPEFQRLPVKIQADVVRRIVLASRGKIQDVVSQLGKASMAAPESREAVRQALQTLSASLARPPR